MLALTAMLALLSLMLFMSTLTIRNLDERVKQKLRIQAARNQTSMEAEARAILRAALESRDASGDPVAARRETFQRLLKEMKAANTDPMQPLSREEAHER